MSRWPSWAPPSLISLTVSVNVIQQWVALYAHDQLLLGMCVLFYFII